MSSEKVIIMKKIEEMKDQVEFIKLEGLIRESEVIAMIPSY